MWRSKKTVNDWVDDLADNPSLVGELDDQMLADITACLEARSQPIDGTQAIKFVAAIVRASMHSVSIRSQPVPGSGDDNAQDWLAEVLGDDAAGLVVERLR